MRKKKLHVVEGMPSMMELFSLFEEAEPQEEDYLHRGERLETLAREKLSRLEQKMKQMESTQQVLFEMDFKNSNFTDKDCFMKIRLIARNLLRFMKDNEEAGAKRIFELTDGICRVKSCPVDDYRMRYITKKGKTQEQDRLMQLEILSDGEPIYVAYGLRDTIVPLDKPSWLFGYEFLSEDLSNIIAYCAMYGSIRSVLGKEDEVCTNFLEGIKEMLDDKKKGINTYESLEKKLFESVRNSVLRYVPRKLHRQADEVLKELVGSGLLGAIHFSIPGNVPMPKPYRDAYAYIGVCITDSEETLFDLSSRARCELGRIEMEVPERDRKAIIRQTILKIPFPLNAEEFDKYSFPVKEWGFFIAEHKVLPPMRCAFLETVHYGRRGSGMEVTRFLRGESYWNGGSWLIRAFQILYEEKHSVVEQYRGYRKSASDYALSFMNKKNIPQKTQEAMKNSLLNQFFGYVEYDEDVDLKKVLIVEKEFEAFKKEYIHVVDGSKNAIRFRKLGNHKASGLYYPGMKCLCVDFRYPDSFIHEYGHLIDYELGSLSLQSEFHRIRSLYRKHLESLSSDVKKSMKGKYNMDYYLTPTEVFARSFEIYVGQVLGVENDLLPKAFNKAVYPFENKEFVDEITAYFNALLQKNSKKEEMTDDAA